MKLDLVQPMSALPEEDASLRLIPSETGGPPSLGEEALPGPRDAHLLFVRFASEWGAVREMRYLVICLRTGLLVNQQSLPLAADAA